MDVLKFDEGVVLPKGMIPLTEMKPQSVVFIFNDNTIDPIACDLDFLYAQTRQRTYYELKNPEKAAETNIFPTNHLGDEMMMQTRMWSFKNFIQKLAFQYGLKHEYYKNIHGKWIDMALIRPHLALSNPSTGIFNGIISSHTIHEMSKDTSIYVKLCDNVHFSYDDWEKFRLKDINDIPDIKYITKDDNSNDGTYHFIKRGDGTYDLEDVPVSVFESEGESAKDNIHSQDKTYAKFKVRLGTYNTDTIGSGPADDNDHHLHNDLHLTFFGADGVTPFTDLDNMIVICNNMFVDYKRSTNNENSIYILNVIKYAEIQRMGTMRKVDEYLNKSASPLQLSTRRHDVMYKLDIDIPNTETGYVYHFDIRVYKWKNVTVSHFIDPLHYNTILKTTNMEANKYFWLKCGAEFSKEIDKSKTILLCGNEIVPQSEWEVDVTNPRRISLKNISKEFDYLYSEMYKKISDYMASYGMVNSENKPKIEDYVESYGNEYDPTITPAERFQRYVEAIEQYTEEVRDTSVLPFDTHYMPSTFDVVKKQFLYKQYAIIVFDTADEQNYSIEVYENHADIEIDTPLVNQIRNKNWSPDDILVVNGLVHRFENLYQDVFTPVRRWYLPVLDKVFEGANIFKLQLKRRYVKNNFYMKLNHTELIAGPITGHSYYTYDEKRRVYVAADVSKGFEAFYDQVDKNANFNPLTVYFTKNTVNEFVKVPTTMNEFDPNTTYYTKHFTKTYYIVK